MLKLPALQTFAASLKTSALRIKSCGSLLGDAAPIMATEVLWWWLHCGNRYRRGVHDRLTLL